MQSKGEAEEEASEDDGKDGDGGACSKSVELTMELSEKDCSSLSVDKGPSEVQHGAFFHDSPQGPTNASSGSNATDHVSM